MDRNSARDKIVGYLKQQSLRAKEVNITEDTEIYYDLRLFGDDLLEFIIWIRNEFGVNMNINISEYGPSESAIPFLFRQWTEKRNRDQKRYKSLKIRDILAVVDTDQRPSSPQH